MAVPDSGFRIPGTGFQSVELGFWISHPGFWIPGTGFRIPVSGTWIRDSNNYRNSEFLELVDGLQSPGFLISVSKHFLDSGFHQQRIPENVLRSGFLYLGR